MTFIDLETDEVSHLNTSLHRSITNKESLAPLATPSSNTEKTTAEHIEEISRLGTSGKSIIKQLEEMEKCMDYLQQQLQENTGYINELDYNIPNQKQSPGKKKIFFYID